jgi:hypothetical protein
MPPDTAATAFAAVAAPTGPTGPTGRPERAGRGGPLRLIDHAAAPADPPAVSEAPVEEDPTAGADRRARRRRTLVLVGLVILGLAATATLMVAGVMFLRDPGTRTIPFLSDDRGNGPIVEPRNAHPGQPGRAGGPAAPPASPSQRPGTAPSAKPSAAAPSATPGSHWPESAQRSAPAGQHWVCTMTRQGVSCVLENGPSGSPSPGPSWSWSGPRYR